MLPSRDKPNASPLLIYNVFLRVRINNFSPPSLAKSPVSLPNASHALRTSKTHASTSYPGRGHGVAEAGGDLWTHYYGYAELAYRWHIFYIKTGEMCFGNSNRGYSHACMTSYLT